MTTVKQKQDIPILCNLTTGPNIVVCIAVVFSALWWKTLRWILSLSLYWLKWAGICLLKAFEDTPTSHILLEISTYYICIPLWMGGVDIMASLSTATPPICTCNANVLGKNDHCHLWTYIVCLHNWLYITA